MIAYRDAVTGRAAALSVLMRGRASPTRSAISTGRTISPRFSTQPLSEQAWRSTAGRSRFRHPPRRGRRRRRRLRQDGTTVASGGATRPDRRSSCTSSMCWRTRQGTGVAATLMDWAIATARARGCARAVSCRSMSTTTARGASTNATASSEIGDYAFMVGEQADEDRSDAAGAVNGRMTGVEVIRARALDGMRARLSRAARRRVDG